jgi:hypothetical protein
MQPDVVISRGVSDETYSHAGAWGTRSRRHGETGRATRHFFWPRTTQHVRSSLLPGDMAAAAAALAGIVSWAALFTLLALE